MRLDIAKFQNSLWARPVTALWVLVCTTIWPPAAGPAHAAAMFTGDVSNDPTLIYPRKHLYVGITGVGSVDISGGDYVANKSAYVGYKGGSDGTVKVSGEGSRWFNYGTVVAGDRGTGRVIVQSERRRP